MMTRLPRLFCESGAMSRKKHDLVMLSVKQLHFDKDVYHESVGTKVVFRLEPYRCECTYVYIDI